MSSRGSPSNPCLLAVLLVTRSASEPRVVFHYPPKPGEDNAHFKYLFKDDEADTTSTTSEAESSAADNAAGTASEGEQNHSTSPPDVEDPGSVSPDKKEGRLKANVKKPQWNDVFGLPSNILARALCPGRGSLKRFELTVGEHVYLGRPIYANEDGSWRKRRRRRSSSMSKSLGGKASTATGSRGSVNRPRHSQSEDSTSAESEAETFRRDSADKQEDSLGLNNLPNGTDSAGLSSMTAEHVTKDTLQMFHMVYVLNPSSLEYHAKVNDMWRHVVRKFARALKWEQSRSEYVTKEVSQINSAVKRVRKASGGKPQLSILYHDVISQCGLAKMIAILYNNISSSRIAHLPLTSHCSLSLQIPIPRSISILPGPLARQNPGLWLTTATTIPAEDDVHLSNTQLASHFTLLLHYDIQVIMADVNTAKSPITDPLLHFLGVIRPTKSLRQIAQSSGIALADIQFLASHLIYWRRAQAIPPLHQRDTYILSPNADMRGLSSATSSFAKAFPTLPSLPQILSMLSSSLPRPYSSLIPSKDHKEAYMNILAWLLRGGWVTQLRSFAWIIIPPHIAETVDRVESTKQQAATSIDKATSKQGPDSPIITHHPTGKSTPLPGTSPVSSTGTAFPIVQAPLHGSSRLIRNPRLASARISRYLSAISAYVGRELGPEHQSSWDKCVKYFDGKHAVENIAVNEGWKRKHVVELLARWEDHRILMQVRHW